MSARKHINRYRTEPSGYDYNEVLKKGKTFHRASGIFDMSPYKGKYDDRVLWTATRHSLPPFKPSEGTRRYKFNIDRKRWEEIPIQAEEIISNWEEDCDA